MNKPATLDLTGGWENIVNNVERHNARVRFEAKLFRRKMKQKINRMADLALGAIISVALGVAGLMDIWIAGAAAVVLVCLVCFLGGRVLESCRRAGIKCCSILVRNLNAISAKEKKEG